MAQDRRTLLAPGNEETWARINEWERRASQPPADMPVEHLLRHGIALSKQAILLLNAVEAADEGRSAPPA